MTRDEHVARHIELHRSLDELVADFLRHHKRHSVSDTALIELIHWSHIQTVSPDGEIH